MTPSLHFSELSVSERRTAIRTYVLAHRKTRPTALLSLVHRSKFGNKIISAKAGDHRCRHFEYQARNDKLKAIITYTRTSASAIHPTEGVEASTDLCTALAEHVQELGRDLLPASEGEHGRVARPVKFLHERRRLPEYNIRYDVLIIFPIRHQQSTTKYNKRRRRSVWK